MSYCVILYHILYCHAGDLRVQPEAFVEAPSQRAALAALA